MHPKKAEVLAKLTKASSRVEAELSRHRSIVRHPSEQGISETLRALAALPLLGLIGVAVDAAEVSVRRSSDGDWGEEQPGSDTTAPPNEES